MPIKLPDLDDRSYEDLRSEAASSLIKLYPAWTDHNPSNPGIALLELFAWLTELVVYRTNQIPERSYESFFKLLNGPTWERAAGQSIDDAAFQTLSAVRERFRAVSADDYEALTLTRWPSSDEARAAGAITSGAAGSITLINRVRCLAERNLEAADKLALAPGHISLIVVVEAGASPSPWLQPAAALSTGLQAFFKDRKLLTTRLHVTGPTYVDIKISATIYLADGADEQTFPKIAEDALLRAFHPCRDPAAPDQPGWPVGRDVHASDVFSTLDAVRGVEFIDNVVIQTGDPSIQSARAILDAGSTVTALRLFPHELPRASSVTLTTLERRGGQWLPISA